LMQAQRPGKAYSAPRKRHASKPKSSAQQAGGQKEASSDPFASVTPVMNTRVRGPSQ
jgi:hypothetical protein